MEGQYTVNQRVRYLIRHLGYTRPATFVKEFFGKSANSEKLRTVWNDENQIKTDFLLEILSKITEKSGKLPNGHWVLTGEGNPYLDEKHTAATNSNEAAVSADRKLLLEELLAEVRVLRTVTSQQSETILNLSRSISMTNQG